MSCYFALLITFPRVFTESTLVDTYKLKSHTSSIGKRKKTSLDQGIDSDGSTFPLLTLQRCQKAARHGGQCNGDLKQK